MSEAFKQRTIKNKLTASYVQNKDLTIKIDLSSNRKFFVCKCMEMREKTKK